MNTGERKVITESCFTLKSLQMFSQPPLYGSVCRVVWGDRDFAPLLLDDEQPESTEDEEEDNEEYKKSEKKWKKALTKECERVEYASPREVKLIKKKEKTNWVGTLSMK
jgi:hypothetical protein